MVSAGEVSSSTFTTMAEDAPNAVVLKDTATQDDGVNLVSRGSKKKNDSPSQKASQVSKFDSPSFQDKLVNEEEK